MDLNLRKWSILSLALATLLITAEGSAVQAACYSSAQRLSEPTVARFTADPHELLSAYPQGGRRMISLVRDLAASDPTTVPLLLDLTANSSARQISSIGTGLGQAALICSGTDPSFAQEIRQMVAAISSEPLTLAFAGVIGDQPRVAGGAAPGPTANASAIGLGGITAAESDATGAGRPPGNSVSGSTGAAPGIVPTSPAGAVAIGTISSSVRTGSVGQLATGSTGSVATIESAAGVGPPTQSQGNQTSVDMTSTNLTTLDVRRGSVTTTNSLSSSVSPSH